MPTRKKPRISAGKRAAINKRVQSAAEVIAWNKEGRPVGRPPRYHEGFCHIAEQCCIINADSPGLADMFCASLEAISQWQHQHQSFLKAIARGKAKTDDEVERALVHRAKGYDHPEDVFMVVSDGAATGSHVETIRTRKYYPPDTHAATFWLKNRKPKEYRPDPLLQPVGPQPEDAAATIRAQLAAMEKSTTGKE